jgi:hypothetical protein
MTISNKAKAEKLTKNQLDCIKEESVILSKYCKDSIDLLNIINNLMGIYLQTQDGGQAKRFDLED